MKFLAIFLLAVCLIQGNAGQFSALRNLVSSASNTASNFASNAVNRVSGVASTAKDTVTNAASTVSNAASTVTNAASTATSAAQDVLNTATSLANTDAMTKAVKDLTPDQLLDTIKEVETQVSALVTKATDKITETVKSAASGPLASTECAKKKVDDAAELTKNIANLVPRAAKLTKDGVEGYRTCSQQTNSFKKNACKAIKIVPIAVKAAILLKDTISYTNSAFKTVTGIHTSIAECATKVVA